jgi:hypothetical protein
MTPFKTVCVAQVPVDALYVFMRERLPELVPDLEDVRSIRVLERLKHADGTLHLVNEWRAKIRVPAVLAGLLHPDDLGWIDRAEYSAKGRVCRWQIRPLFLDKQIRCEGMTTYEPAIAGRGARVTFEGRFEFDPATLQRHVGILEKPVTQMVELIVTTIIPRNFRKTIEAAARRIGPTC